MQRLYFCRHGQSVYNAQELFAGQTNTPLTDMGREQAKAAGQQATNLGIELIVASPLSRAFETAQIIAGTINYATDKILVHDDLMERGLGSLEGLPFSTIPDEADHPDIEPAEHLDARVRAILEYLQQQTAGTILIVSHGAFGKAMHNILEPSILHGELPNAKIVQFI